MIIPVVREKIRVKLAPAVPAGALKTLKEKMIQTPPLLALKRIKALYLIKFVSSISFIFEITQNYTVIFLKVIRRRHARKITQFFWIEYIIELFACTQKMLAIKFYYISPIFYFFKQVVSRINIIKSRLILLILLYFKVC